MLRRASLLASLCFVVLGCAGASDDPLTTAGSGVTAGSQSASEVRLPSAVPAASAQPSAAAPSALAPTASASAKLGRDHRSFVACSADSDCGWDDSCFPTRCVEAGPPQACEESAPRPGSCSCVLGACTLKPNKPPVASGPCEVRGCVVDRAAGACVADTKGVPENIRVNPGVEEGPSCDCVTPSKGCTFQWFDAVPCKTARDCWIDPSPRKHPVARPKHLRGRDFKPCEDGEVAPQCRAGFCALGPAYSC